MPFSDLDILNIAAEAKKRRTGPKGEPGVGIAGTDQPAPDRFQFLYTDGNQSPFITLPEGPQARLALPGLRDSRVLQVLQEVQAHREHQAEMDATAEMLRLLRPQLSMMPESFFSKILMDESM